MLYVARLDDQFWQEAISTVHLQNQSPHKVLRLYCLSLLLLFQGFEYRGSSSSMKETKKSSHNKKHPSHQSDQSSRKIVVWPYQCHSCYPFLKLHGSSSLIVFKQTLHLALSPFFLYCFMCWESGPSEWEPTKENRSRKIRKASDQIRCKTGNKDLFINKFLCAWLRLYL